MGGTLLSQLTTLAKELWTWAFDKDIGLSAQHITGVPNTIADIESQIARDRSDWMLRPRTFLMIKEALGPHGCGPVCIQTDSSTTCFFSWRPDPQAEAVDAFSQDWGPLRGFANPP